MFGMGFLPFLFITIISAIVAVTYHNILQYRFLAGKDALVGKLMIAWLGAWVGSPVLGHWLWKIDNVYLVPALLGAIGGVHLTVLAEKAVAKFLSVRAGATEGAKELRPGKSALAA